MNEQVTPRRTRVTLDEIIAKIKNSQYTRLSDRRTTLCQLTMANGYTILGTSACVDAANYNQGLGEKYSYEDAINKAWPLEGYLLAEELSKENA